MGRLVTLGEIKRHARELADQESQTSDFIDETELRAMVNRSVGRWHGILARAVPERYEAEAAIDPQDPASLILPEDYFATLAVEYEEQGYRYDIHRAMFAERNRYQSISPNEHAIAYRISANRLILLPETSTGNYFHLYVTLPPLLVNDSDTIDGVNGWEEWIIFDVAIKMVLKEESDPSPLILERNKIQFEMDAAAEEREYANPSRVADSRHTDEKYTSDNYYRYRYFDFFPGGGFR